MKTDQELVAVINQVFREEEMSDEELNRLLSILEDECPGITGVLFGNDGHYTPEQAIVKAREDFRIFSAGSEGTEVVHPRQSDKDKSR